MRTYFAKAAWMLVGVGALMGACSVDTKPTNPDGLVPASVNALSTYDAALGTVVTVTGRNFPGTGTGYLQLVFKGDFIADNGATWAVPEIAVNLEVLSATQAAWDKFGPFYNPFDREGNNTGYFEGEMSARVITPDGGLVLDQAEEAIPISFKVKPSIRVRQFLPITLPDDACGGVAVQRAINRLPYVLRVEALGFDPIKFEYTISAPGLDALVEGYAPLYFEQPVQGRFGTLGMDPANRFTLWDVPNSRVSYTAIVDIAAYDAQGNSYRNTFGIGVHRPMEAVYNGNLKVAEYLAPVTAVSCVYGGDAGAGANLILTKSHADTRAIAESVAWSDTWMASHTVSTQEQVGQVQTATDGFSLATLNGNEFLWELAAGGEVSGSVNGSINLSLGGNGGGAGGDVGAKAAFGGHINNKDINSTTATGSNIDSLSTSEVTTRAEADALLRSRQDGGAISEVVSSTDVLGEGLTYNVVPQLWGMILQQPIRLLREAQIVEYSQCGAPTIRGDYTLDDWTWQATLALGTTCFDAQSGEVMQNNLHEPACVVERDKCKYQ
ncbi:MAG: hypothetical protein H6714_11230 [Myxococcales bacterium]|nr:hypothetical protein [Myxococcales bacterium]